MDSSGSLSTNSMYYFNFIIEPDEGGEQLQAQSLLSKPMEEKPWM
jgi:hypothetical protein